MILHPYQPALAGLCRACGRGAADHPRPTFGRDRIADPTAPSWPTLDDVATAQAAAYHKWALSPAPARKGLDR